MLTDIQRAMLGDHEAAKRLTEQGVLLACPMCGKAAVILLHKGTRVKKQERTQENYI